jgi:chromosome partitioning protein
MLLAELGQMMTWRYSGMDSNGRSLGVMVTICIANMKGGVGKTTLCVNLAFTLLDRYDKSVLVVDNDPQFNATTALMPAEAYINTCLKEGPDRRSTTYDIFEKPPRVGRRAAPAPAPDSFFIRTWYKGTPPKATLELIASRLELYETLRNPSQKEHLLDKFLQRHAQHFDYVLIDCPPTPGVLTLSAFAASDWVLIPVKPDYFSAFGLPQFLATLDEFKSDVIDPHDIKPLGVVFVDVPRQLAPDNLRGMDRVEKTVEEIRPDVPVLRSHLTHLSVFQKALWQSMPVARIAGRGVRGKSDASRELLALAKEIMDKTQGQ